jgi:hypothetical protein
MKLKQVFDIGSRQVVEADHLFYRFSDIQIVGKASGPFSSRMDHNTSLYLPNLTRFLLLYIFSILTFY